MKQSQLIKDLQWLRDRLIDNYEEISKDLKGALLTVDKCNNVLEHLQQVNEHAGYLDHLIQQLEKEGTILDVEYGNTDPRSNQ